MSRMSLGAIGEKMVIDAVRAQYQVSRVHSRKQGDIVLTNGLKIEVKTAKRGIDGSFQYCLFRQNRTDIAHSDIVVFIEILCENCFKVYVVPSSELQGIKTLKIRKSDNHRLSSYQSGTILSGVNRYVA